MATSKFNICSQALTKLGKGPISSFIDVSNTEAAVMCGLLWDDESKFIQSCFSWRFNSTKQDLSILGVTPVNEWTYAYQLPDHLNLRAVYNSSDAGARPMTEYEIFGNELYTDSTVISIDFQVEKDVPYWPPYFVQFAIAHFASVLAPAITNKSDISQYWDEMAWGPKQDNRRGGLFGVAKDIDSKIMPAEPIRSNELIAARFS